MSSRPCASHSASNNSVRKPANYGRLLPPHFSQTLWNRRFPGRNAFTLINIVMARKHPTALQAGAITFPPVTVSDEWLRLLTESIDEGNTIHDFAHQENAVNYSAQEAAARFFSHFLQAGDELPASLSPLVPDELTLHHRIPTALASSLVQFAVFTSNTGYSDLVVADGNSSNVVLIDTHLELHKLSEQGALTATGSVAYILGVFSTPALGTLRNIDLSEFPLTSL